MASTVKSKVAGIFGIGSPSRVFAGYGRNLMEGLAQGIIGASGLPVAALAGVDGSLTLPAYGAGAGSLGSTQNAADRPTVIEEHYHIHPPGGTALVGSAETVARLLAPALSSQSRTAAKRRARRR